MKGVVAALYRYPVKGFTPERLDEAALTPGAGVAHDRLYAVEDGPSGFDLAAPTHIPKMRFTVLAKLPEVARIRTRFDDATGVLHAEAPQHAPISTPVRDENGRAAFAAWLTNVLSPNLNGPLHMFEAPGSHRFFDHPQGALSLINLASVRDIAQRIGRPVDPLRFRANLHVEGWPAWSELDIENAELALGSSRVSVFKPIRRCLATHVDPTEGVRDIDMLETLQREYGHLHCGIYLHVQSAGFVRTGDGVELAQ